MSHGVSWDRETVFHNGDEFFAQFLLELKSAEHSIDLETYIFLEDSLGKIVLDRLRQAAKRGVRVRILVDGIGTPSFTRQMIAELARHGIIARVYHPLPWIFPRITLKPSRLMAFFAKVNRRDHRKMFLIDGKVAWVGSFNISGSHLLKYKGARAWRDSGVRVQGKEVQLLGRAFDRSWLRAKGAMPSPRPWKSFLESIEIPRITKSPIVRINSSRAARRHFYNDLLKRILKSKTRVWITNAYFVPDILLIRALRIAAWAGSDVRVLVPKHSDIFFMPWVIPAFYSRLLNAGVRVFEYIPRFLHAKTLIIDDWAIVGSSNLNHRSLLHDLEVDIVLGRVESLSSLEEQFIKDLGVSREVTLAEWRTLPLWQRMAGRILLFFRYWF